MRPKGKHRVGGGDRTLIFRLHARGHARRLQFPGNDPTANLIEQQSLYATVQRVQLSLVIGRRLPLADDILAILIKMKVKPKRVIGRTADAVVARHPLPRVDNLLHRHSKLKMYRFRELRPFLQAFDVA